MAWQNTHFWRNNFEYRGRNIGKCNPIIISALWHFLVFYIDFIYLTVFNKVSIDCLKLQHFVGMHN